MGYGRRRTRGGSKNIARSMFCLNTSAKIPLKRASDNTYFGPEGLSAPLMRVQKGRSSGRSLHEVVKPFVEWTPQPRLDLFAKELAMFLGHVCIIFLPVLPNFNDAKMIGPHNVLKKLESH